MARQALATLTTMTAPRPVWPITTPTGMAISAAMSSGRPL